MYVLTMNQQEKPWYRDTGYPAVLSIRVALKTLCTSALCNRKLFFANYVKLRHNWHDPSNVSKCLFLLNSEHCKVTYGGGLHAEVRANSHTFFNTPLIDFSSDKHNFYNNLWKLKYHKTSCNFYHRWRWTKLFLEVQNYCLGWNSFNN